MFKAITVFPHRARMLMAVVLPVLLAGNAQANFAKVGGNEAACDFKTQYTFEFKNNPQLNDLIIWDVILKGPFQAGKVNLDVTLRHFVGMPQCDNGHGANANGQTFSFVVAPPAAGKVSVASKAALISHGVHSDVFRTTVTAVGPVAANPASGAITAAGEHTKGAGLQASVENTGTTTLKNVTVTPSYFNPATGLTTDGPPIKRKDLKPGESDKVDLPNAGKLVPTDYKITASGSPTTVTTIAFLGTINGTPAELPLGDFAQLFEGNADFLLPMLRASDDLTDLFVGVDLTQWLGDPQAFTAGEAFSFVNGVSDALPGFMVGTSAISFDATSGSFVSADPYTGNGFVAATIDGSVIPEPSSLALILGSLSILGLARWRPRT